MWILKYTIINSFQLRRSLGHFFNNLLRIWYDEMKFLRKRAWKVRWQNVNKHLWSASLSEAIWNSNLLTYQELFCLCAVPFHLNNKCSSLRQLTVYTAEVWGLYVENCLVCRLNSRRTSWEYRLEQLSKYERIWRLH